MIVLIPADSRGLTKLDWLNSRHSFSFGGYYNPKKMGFGELRVLNDDTVAPGQGFGMHFHDNMEIVTFVLKGSLEHKDSTGGEGVLKAGQMQRMTAGKGIQHSEFNPSKSESAHFLQIWVIPETQDLEPEYEQKDMHPSQTRTGRIARFSAKTREYIIHPPKCPLFDGPHRERQAVKLYPLFQNQTESTFS